MTPRTQATHARWQEGLTRLRAYAEAHGAGNPHTRAVVDGFRLGRWAALQRERYWANRLPPEHVTALQGVPGWDWGRTNADRWAEGFTHLRSYLREHGTTAVDTRTVHEGFQLGGWVARRRSNYHRGTLSPTRIAALEALAGWVWTRTEDRWPPGLKALRSYIKKHGTARVPLDATERRYPLGLWVADRRAQYKRGTLSPEQIATLQDLPGWVWDVKQARWEQGLRLLTAYAHRTGAPNPDSFYIEAAEGNFTLGAWAMSRRKEYRRGVLCPDRVAALEAIPGWEWNPHDAAWHRMFAHLKQAAHHHGTVAHITQTTVIDGANIGHWVMAQRTRHRQGRLTTDRAHTLQALPGWDWAPHTAHQQPGSTANPPTPSDS